MAQITIKSRQINIPDVADAIAADPSASATFDAEYLRRDGSTLMLGNLNLDTFNLITAGLVDGRNVSSDGATQDAHIADGTLHFTQAAISITEIQVSDLQPYILDVTADLLGDLLDVTISLIDPDEILKWTGSAWINNTLAEANISAVGHNHVKSDVTNFTESEYAHTFGTETIAGDKTFSDNIIISGDLTIDGTVTTINTTTLEISDNIYLLNSDLNEFASPTEDAGMEVNRGVSDNVSWLWDESVDTFRPLIAALEAHLGYVLDPANDNHVGDRGYNDLRYPALVHTHVMVDITDSTWISNITSDPLSNLSDVTLTSITSGEILKWSGSAWINNTLSEAGISADSHTHVLDDLTDVIMTGSPVAITNDALVFDGANWTNQTIDHTNLSSIGTNSHTTIDSHLANNTLHFTVGSISHTLITNTGTTSHTDIDSHISGATLKHTAADIVNIPTGSPGIIATDLQAAIDELYTEKEPVFAKNTGFNLDLGTTGATVSEGDHGHITSDISDFSTGVTTELESNNIDVLSNVVLTGSPLAITNDVLIFDGADWTNQTVDHANLSNIGTNTHSQIDSHIAGTTLKHTAADVVNVPTGNVIAIDIQAAIDELDAEKAPTASPIFTGVPVLPSYLLAGLPVVVEGGMIFVSDATAASGTGAMCFGQGIGSPLITDWIDVTTGNPVI